MKNLSRTDKEYNLGKCKCKECMNLVSYHLEFVWFINKL